MTEAKVREAVGVFHDEAALQAAADELMAADFDRSALSLLAGNQAVEEKLGHVYEKVADLEDQPDAPTQAYTASDSRTEAKGLAAGGLAYIGAVGAVGIIVASGGTLAAAVVGAVLAGGAGGAVGTCMAHFIDKPHADSLHAQLDRGGLLLWVRTQDEAQEAKAKEILTGNGAEDVHVHDLPEIKYATEGGLSHDDSFMQRLGL